MILPRITTVEEYVKVYADTGVWLPAVREIASRHGLSPDPTRQTLGTHVVFGFGDLILKLYCPLWREDHRVEKIALEHIHGLPVPEIEGEGELDGWPYLIVSRIGGVPAAAVWRSLPARSKHIILEQLGDFMRGLHGHDLPADLPADWGDFIRARLAHAESHHDMPEPWRGWIREQLADFHEPPLGHVLLNGDLTEDHLLLEERGGKWSLAGVIDFGDARVGHPYYEFIAPLAFYTYGEPGLSAELVRAYGLEPSPDVLVTLTKYCLLHEFGRLSQFLERYPAGGPEEFCRAMWGGELS